MTARPPIPGSTYTDFDRLKLDRLPNWGRWGRQDTGKPHPSAITTAYRLGPDDGSDRDQGAVHAIPPPIDFRDAEILDGFILQLGLVHKRALQRTYYRTPERDRDRPRGYEVDAAVRALMDAIAENRRVCARVNKLRHPG